MSLEWFRVGRKLGRTIYVHRTPDPGDDGELIGLMDTREWAARVVAALNRATGSDQQPGDGGS